MTMQRLVWLSEPLEAEHPTPADLAHAQQMWVLICEQLDHLAVPEPRWDVITEIPGGARRILAITTAVPL